VPSESPLRRLLQRFGRLDRSVAKNHPPIAAVLTLAPAFGLAIALRSEGEVGHLARILAASLFGLVCTGLVIFAFRRRRREQRDIDRYLAKRMEDRQR
jgi:cbb3-type cytochrome oxidase subunit 3